MITARDWLRSLVPGDGMNIDLVAMVEPVVGMG
jgi:hypothetical protein